MPRHCLVSNPNSHSRRASTTLGVYVEADFVNQDQEVKNLLAQECNADRPC
jgi:hypothetical protein